MDVNAIALKKATEQNHFRREQAQSSRDGRRVLAEDSCGLIDDFHDAFIAVDRAFKNHGRQPRDVHLVGGLRPPDQFIAAVQTEGAQDGGRELRLAPVQIVCAQNEAERLERKEISPAGIAQNVTPSTRLLDPVPAAPGDRGTGSGIDGDAVAAPKRGRQPGIAIAPGDDLCLGPNLAAEVRQEAAVFLGRTSREKHSHPVRFRRHLGKDRAQTFR